MVILLRWNTKENEIFKNFSLQNCFFIVHYLHCFLFIMKQVAKKCAIQYHYNDDLIELLCNNNDNNNNNHLIHATRNRGQNYSRE